jgi:muconolactone delta-isomerase
MVVSCMIVGLMRVAVMLLMVEGTVRAMIVGSRFVDLDLQGRVPDAEMVFQLPLGLRQEAVTRMPARHHEMRREGRFRGAHGPDMQVMDAGDARQILESLPNFRYRNATRHPMKRQGQGLL